MHHLPSVTEFTTKESRPDLGTMAFPVLDRLPSVYNEKIQYILLQKGEESYQ